MQSCSSTDTADGRGPATAAIVLSGLDFSNHLHARILDALGPNAVRVTNVPLDRDSDAGAPAMSRLRFFEIYDVRACSDDYAATVVRAIAAEIRAVLAQRGASAVLKLSVCAWSETCATGRAQHALVKFACLNDE